MGIDCDGYVFLWKITKAYIAEIKMQQVLKKLIFACQLLSAFLFILFPLPFFIEGEFITHAQLQFIKTIKKLKKKAQRP